MYYGHDVIFTYRRGVKVARFDRMGNPRASKRGAGNGQVSTLFLYLGLRPDNDRLTDIQSYENTILET